jgi:hypothetical protein
MYNEWCTYATSISCSISSVWKGERPYLLPCIDLHIYVTRTSHAKALGD